MPPIGFFYVSKEVMKFAGNMVFLRDSSCDLFSWLEMRTSPAPVCIMPIFRRMMMRDTKLLRMQLIHHMRDSLIRRFVRLEDGISRPP